MEKCKIIIPFSIWEEVIKFRPEKALTDYPRDIIMFLAFFQKKQTNNVNLELLDKNIALLQEEGGLDWAKIDIYIRESLIRELPFDFLAYILIYDKFWIFFDYISIEREPPAKLQKIKPLF